MLVFGIRKKNNKGTTRNIIVVVVQSVKKKEEEENEKRCRCINVMSTLFNRTKHLSAERDLF